MDTYGFLRSINSSSVSSFVTFTAPNGQKLHSVEEIKTYLFSNDKCKCGLSDEICLTKFDFDPSNYPPPIKLTIRRKGNTYSTSSRDSVSDLSVNVGSKQASNKTEYCRMDRSSPSFTDIEPILSSGNAIESIKSKTPELADNIDEEPLETVDLNTNLSDMSFTEKFNCTEINQPGRAQKRFGSELEVSQTKKIKVEINSKKTKKIKNLESILGKIEEVRERKLSTEHNQGSRTNKRIINYNNSNSRNERKQTPEIGEKLESFAKPQQTILERSSQIFERNRSLKKDKSNYKTDELEIEDFVIIDSFTDTEQKEEVGSRVSTPESVFEEKIFDQFREKMNNSFHFNYVTIDKDDNIPQPKSLQSTLQTVTRRTDICNKFNKSEFAVGDLIWGNNCGCPAWPGIIVDSEDVIDKTKISSKNHKNKIWVMWFGDRSYSAMNSSELKDLEEGLNASGSTAIRKISKRVMARLDKAIEEVLLEYSNKEKRSKLRKRKK